MYQTFSSKAGLKYTNKLNKTKPQFTIVSNNYFQWKLLLFVATVTLFNNRCFEIKARKSLLLKFKLARDDVTHFLVPSN